MQPKYRPPVLHFSYPTTSSRYDWQSSPPTAASVLVVIQKTVKRAEDPRRAIVGGPKLKSQRACNGQNLITVRERKAVVQITALSVNESPFGT